MENKQNDNKRSSYILNEKDKQDEIREALGCIFSFHCFLGFCHYREFCSILA